MCVQSVFPRAGLSPAPERFLEPERSPLLVFVARENRPDFSYRVLIRWSELRASIVLGRNDGRRPHSPNLLEGLWVYRAGRCSLFYSLGAPPGRSGRVLMS